jgi:O-antigen/teichoic acid export membrane protein
MDPASAPAQPEPHTPKGERGSYRSGFLFGALSFVGVAVLGLVSTIITSRLYGVRVIGQYALVFVPVAALWVLSTVKEQQALIREITGLPARHERVTQLFSVVFTFSFALTLAVAVLDAVVCWFVFRGPLNAPDLLAPALVNIAGYAAFTNTGWNIDSILSAFVAGRQIFWVRLHEVVSFILIAVAIGFFWRSVWGLVIAMVGSSLTSLIHRTIVVRPFIRARLSRAEYRLGLAVLPDLLRFGLRATPGQIAQGISQQGGIWALGVVAPVATVGAYSRAYMIPQRLQQASNRITEVLYPTLVGRHAAGDGHGFDRALIDSIRYEVIGMLLIASAIGGAAHSVLDLFGPGFGRAAPALVLLALFPALASITVTQTQALWARNQPGRTSLIAIVRLVLTIGLLILLTPRVGIIGPAIALLAGYLAVAVLSGVAVRPLLTRRLRATWPRRERLSVLAAYGAGFATAHLLEQAAPSTLGLLLCLPAGCAAYLAVFVVSGGANGRDRGRLSELAGSVRSRAGLRLSGRGDDAGSPTPAPAQAIAGEARYPGA